MVILYPSYDINELKGSVNSGSPCICCKNKALLRLYPYFVPVPFCTRTRILYPYPVADLSPVPSLARCAVAWPRPTSLWWPRPLPWATAKWPCTCSLTSSSLRPPCCPMTVTTRSVSSLYYINML